MNYQLIVMFIFLIMILHINNANVTTNNIIYNNTNNNDTGNNITSDIINNDNANKIFVKKKNLYQRITKIYVINLKKRNDRKRKILKILQKHFSDKKIYFFNAIEKKDIYTKENKKLWLKKLSSKLRKNNGNFFQLAQQYSGTVACYLSHLKVLMNLDSINPIEEDEIFLVMEDDCFFDEKTIQLLKSQNFVASLPNNWFILKPTCGKKDKQDKINNVFYNVTKARNRTWDYYFGNHFMLYNAQKLTDVIQTIDQQNVHDIDIIIAKHVNNIYAFDSTIKQKKSISDRAPN